MVLYETQKVFLIPDDSRDVYFEMMERMGDLFPRLLSSADFEDVWDVNNDPIIKVDFSYFNKKGGEWVLSRLKEIGANDITDSILNNNFRKNLDV